jgi:glycosyltransferase involved in cell wall biosynthesis
MRVALVVAGGVDRSGRERVIPVLLSLIERLARRHHVVVYVLRYYEQPCTYSLLGATIRDLGRPEGIRRQYAALYAAVVEDGPFDVLHGYWALPSGLVTAVVGRRLGIPSIVTCDSGEFVSLPDISYGSQTSWRQRLGIAATAGLATRLTAGSRFQARLANQRGLRPTVLPIGPDRTVFTPATRSEGPPWRLLSVARIHPVKDPKTLVTAVRALRAAGLDVHLDLVGADTMAGAIHSLARELRVEQSVTFHGFVPTDALVPLYQRAHVLLLPSRHEAAPVVVLEAALCGVPVVGTPVGFVADWSPDAAVAVPAQSPDGLADAVRSLIADRPRRENLAREARSRALVHDADWSAAELERLYADVMPRSRRAP